MPMHSIGVGRNAGEQPECFDRLEHCHPATVQRSAAQAIRYAQQLGFQREVNYFRNPEPVSYTHLTLPTILRV